MADTRKNQYVSSSNIEKTNIKEMINKEQIGSNLKRIREQNNITQEDMAEILNVSRRTIQYLEAGKRFNIDTACEYLQHFGYQLAFLKDSAIITENR